MYVVWPRIIIGPKVGSGGFYRAASKTWVNTRSRSPPSCDGEWLFRKLTKILSCLKLARTFSRKGENKWKWMWSLSPPDKCPENIFKKCIILKLWSYDIFDEMQIWIFLWSTVSSVIIILKNKNYFQEGDHVYVMQHIGGGAFKKCLLLWKITTAFCFQE